MFGAQPGQPLIDSTNQSVAFPAGATETATVPFFHPESAPIDGGTEVWTGTPNLRSRADFLQLDSNDATTQPVYVTLTGTPTTGGANIGFTLSDGTHTATVTAPQTTGESLSTLAAAILTAFQANTTVWTIFGKPCTGPNCYQGIIDNAQANVIGTGVITFNLFWPMVNTATVTAIGDAHVTVSVSAIPTILEINPWLGTYRHVAGRTSLAGDLIGAFNMGGDLSDGRGTTYGQIITSIADPTDGTQLGKICLQEANWFSGVCVSHGVTINAAGAAPAGGDKGNGTLNLDNGYYVRGVQAIDGSDGGHFGFLTVLGANGGVGQARFKYDAGSSGLLINQRSANGSVQILDQEATGFMLLSAGTGAGGQLQLNASSGSSEFPNGPVTITSNSSTGLSVLGSGGQVQANFKFDSTSNGLLIGQTAHQGAASISQNDTGATLALSVASGGVIRLETGASGGGAEVRSGILTLGAPSTQLTGVTGELGMLISASGSAPGAGGAKLAMVCSATLGKAKLIAYAGTSTTPVTIADNIGGSVTGC